MARVFDRLCQHWWNYKIQQHTYRGYSPDDKIWCSSTVRLLPQGSKVEAGHSFAAFDTLCIGFRPRTPPSTRSDEENTHLLSGRQESMKSKHCALDSKQWRSSCCAILSLADWIKLDLNLSTCAWTWYGFEHEISNVGCCFSIPLSWSPLCVPQMVWTKCCSAELRCSSTSLLSSSVGFQLMHLQHIVLHNLLSPRHLHSSMAICSTWRGPGVCPLQIQYASWRSDQIRGCCDCRRPLSEV